MGIPEKNISANPVAIIQVFSISGDYVGYILHKDYENKYKTKKLIGQSKPSFTLTMQMCMKEADQFPQGVGKIRPTKGYKIQGIRFMASFTLLKVNVQGKDIKHPIPVEVRFTEL